MENHIGSIISFITMGISILCFKMYQSALSYSTDE